MLKCTPANLRPGGRSVCLDQLCAEIRNIRRVGIYVSRLQIDARILKRDSGLVEALVKFLAVSDSEAML